MPPIKRNQKPAAQPPRRRLAGHAGPVRPEDAPRAEAGAGDGRGSRPVVGPSLEKKYDDDEAAVTHGEPDTDGARRAGPRGPAARTAAYAGIAVGLVAGVAGVVLAFQPGISVENRAFVDRAATDEVLAAATTNVQRLVAIDHEELDAYHDSLGEFLTPKLVEELNANWPALRDSYEQSATTVDAQVREAGLAFLEGDRAEVLLVQDVSMSRDGVAAGSTSGTYLVGMDKVDGTWKLSRIPDLPS